MSDFLGKYKEDRANALRALDLLIEKQIVPVKLGKRDYSINTVKELKTNLEEEVFTISVCGQINAGKSSLLNYLLFNGKSILPADDTPWTAKLSTISYGETEEVIVTYYSKSEWETLKGEKYKDTDTNNTTTYYDQFLKSDVEKLAWDGIKEEQYIQANNKVETCISLNDIDQYVAKKGKYTPFVSHVDIKVNNELLRGVQFVDTPGLNDRNVLRSKVTEDWIIKSSAVVYLFYTGQPLSAPDYMFIDQHLSNVDSDKILFVLTKADTSGDYEDALSYVDQSLRTDSQLKNRGLLDGKEVYPISTLAAKLDSQQAKNEALNEDDEYHLDRIKDNCEALLHNQGRIPELVTALRSHIIKDTKTSVLTQARLAITGICDTTVQVAKKEIGDKEAELDSVELSFSDIEKEETSLNTQRRSFGALYTSLKNKEITLQNKCESKIVNLFLNYKKDIIEKVGIEEIEDKPKLYDPNIIQHMVKLSIENVMKGIVDDMDDLGIDKDVSDFKTYIDSEVKSLTKGKLKENMRYFEMPSISCKELIENAKINSINAEFLKSCKVESRWWIGRMFGYSDIDASKTNIIAAVDDLLDKYMVKTQKHLNYLLRKSIKVFLTEMTSGLTSEAVRLQEQVTRLKNSKVDKVELRTTYKSDLKALITKKELIDRHVKDLILPLLS